MLPVGLWLAGTMAHVAFAGRAARRWAGHPGLTTDEWLFSAVLIGVGSLSCALHAAALTFGLSLTTGLVAIGIWHVVSAAASRLWPSAAQTGPARVATIRDGVAMAVLLALALTWIDASSRTTAVDGADAMHYHVPNAINFALGVSPFALPATPHLYPMAGSLIDAWFIVPTGDVLLVDLAILLPFLLLVSALLWLFRLCTGQSGLTWAIWPVLLLFSTRLFQASSLVSADLWFASGFVSLTAVLTAIWVRRAWRVTDVLLCGLAVGLLVGVKATGLPAAGLLIGVYVVAHVARRVLGRVNVVWPQSVWQPVVVAGLSSTLAGGIWLVRNWRLFGSPIAPNGLTIFGLSIFSGPAWESTTYLSVLGDVRANPSYALGAQSMKFVQHWLGGWYPAMLLPAALVPIDWLLSRREPVPHGVAAARVCLLIATAGVGGALVYVLVGAPWTSLEWTGGFALRYALPVAALLPLTALVALFPFRWPWYERRWAWIAWDAVSIVAAWIFAGPLLAKSLTAPDRPLLAWWWLVAALAAVSAAAFARRRSVLSHARLVAAVMIALVVAWMPVIARRDASIRRTAREQEALERIAFAAGHAPGSPGRAAYLATLADEDVRGRTCRDRRFIALTRFDEPMTLESPNVRAEVFYGGRELSLARRTAPIGSCDYIITSRALMDTDKGRALVEAFGRNGPTREVAEVGPFLVLGR